MYKGIKIATVTPDRGDRPEFLAHCRWLIDRQTVQPDMRIVVDYPALSNQVDIKQRYMLGSEQAVAAGCRAILFIENDDNYRADYIEYMIDNWDAAGRPVIFGLDTTIYYNIRHNCWKKMAHPGRSSAMSMLITPAALDIDWGLATDPYLDIFLWQHLAGVAFSATNIVNIGIKHNIGRCGGQFHKINDGIIRRANQDPDMAWLAENVDSRSLEFYKHINARLNDKVTLCHSREGGNP
jgi:hypothetical protein